MAVSTVSEAERATRRLLGRNVRRLRLERTLSQEALSDAVGTSQSHISEIEYGKLNPSVDLIGRIARVLDVPVAHLFDERQDATTKRLART